ncbi:MAG: divalent metal cation transporter [Firmicutes bacterium]|nr:divalent metal cation transporter [Bacillota bacterium]
MPTIRPKDMLPSDVAKDLHSERPHPTPVGVKKRVLPLFLLLMGPGLLAMIGDNDAGGVVSYAATGIQFGWFLFLPILLLLAPVTYTIQEMTMRLGLVSQRPFPVLVIERFGRFWGYFSLLSLLAENLLTLMTEFIGMSIGLSVLGIPFMTADLISLVLVGVFALVGKYWTKERLALLVGVLNVVFVAVAWLAHPDGAAMAHTFSSLQIIRNQSNLFLFYAIATVGNAVAPWMIFFQGSAVIDKGMTHTDLRYGRMDTALGSVVQVVIAASIIVCGAALHLYSVHHPAVLSAPVAMLHGYLVQNGAWVRDLFALGLFNAGFLASITISLSTSWTFAGVFGWAKSLDDHFRQAPKFYGLYIGGLVLAALLVLLPQLPLTFLAVLTQVIAGVLMVPLLVLMTRLTSSEPLMGMYRNSRLTKWRAWTIVAVMAALTLWLLLHLL